MHVVGQASAVSCLFWFKGVCAWQSPCMCFADIYKVFPTLNIKFLCLFLQIKATTFVSYFWKNGQKGAYLLI